MPDELKNRGAPDQVRINVHEQHEVRYWKKELDCSEQELLDAVRTVGVLATMQKVTGQTSLS